MISLLITIIISSVFIILAYSGIFGFIESRYYNKKIQQEKNELVARFTGTIRGFHEQNLKEYSVLLSLEGISDNFLAQQSDTVIKTTEDGFRELLLRQQGLIAVRFVDNDGKIHYSTDISDRRISGSVQNIVYKKLSDISEDKDILLLNDGDKPDFLVDEARQRFIYRLPVYDEFSIFKGTALFFLSILELKNRLVVEQLIDIGTQMLLLKNGYVFNLFIRINDELKQGIINSWAETGAGMVPLFSTNDKDNILIDTAYDKEVGYVSILVLESDFRLNSSLKLLLSIAFCITVFLITFLIFNFRQDRLLILSERVKRFQIHFLQEYLDSKQEVDWEKWKRELELKKESVNTQIKKGLGKIDGHEKDEINTLINRSWDEIIGIIDKGSERKQLPDTQIEKIEEIFAKLLEKQTAGKAALPDLQDRKQEQTEEDEAVSELESVEAVDELEEVEAFEGPEEAEAVEELDEVEELEEVEAADTEPEEIEIIDEIEEVEEAEAVEESEAAEDLEAVEELEALEAVPGAVDEPEEVETVTDAESAVGIQHIQMDSRKKKGRDSSFIDVIPVSEMDMSAAGVSVEARDVWDYPEVDQFKREDVLIVDVRRDIVLSQRGQKFSDFEELDTVFDESGGVFGLDSVSAAQYKPWYGEFADGNYFHKAEYLQLAQEPPPLDTIPGFIKELEIKNRYSQKLIREAKSVAINIGQGDELYPAYELEGIEAFDLTEMFTEITEVGSIDVFDEEEKPSEPEQVEDLEAVDIEVFGGTGSEAAGSSKDDEDLEEMEVIEDIEEVDELEEVGDMKKAEKKTEAKSRGKKPKNDEVLGPDEAEVLDEIELAYEAEEIDTMEEIESIEEIKQAGKAEEEIEEFEKVDDDFSGEPGREMKAMDGMYEGSDEEGELEELEELEELDESDQDTAELSGVEVDVVPDFKTQLEHAKTKGFIILADVKRYIEKARMSRVIDEDNGLYSINKDTLASAERSVELDENMKKLVDSVIDSPIKGVTEAMEIPTVDLSLSIDEKLGSGEEYGSEEPSKDMDVFDYDAYTRNYKGSSISTLKSLMILSGNMNAIFAGIIEDEGDALMMTSYLGMENQSFNNFVFKKEEDLYKEILVDFSKIVFMPKPISLIREFDNKLSKGDKSYIKASLYLPICFKKKKAYLFFGMKEVNKTLDNYLEIITKAFFL
ncbi:MAG: hypothetical protein JW874_15630 [Spirochaetales bacterium]|nr:hypothetical protein [Spirochaetales bacterium]